MPCGTDFSEFCLSDGAFRIPRALGTYLYLRPITVRMALWLVSGEMAKPDIGRWVRALLDLDGKSWEGVRCGPPCFCAKKVACVESTEHLTSSFDSAVALSRQSAVNRSSGSMTMSRLDNSSALHDAADSHTFAQIIQTRFVFAFSRNGLDVLLQKLRRLCARHVLQHEIK